MAQVNPVEADIGLYTPAPLPTASKTKTTPCHLTRTPPTCLHTHRNTRLGTKVQAQPPKGYNTSAFLPSFRAVALVVETDAWDQIQSPPVTSWVTVGNALKLSKFHL